MPASSAITDTAQTRSSRQEALLFSSLRHAFQNAASAIARTRGSLIAAFAVCLAAVLFGSSMYFDALFLHISSTSALVFVFIPLYQLVAAVVVVIIAAERRKHATRKIQASDERSGKRGLSTSEVHTDV